MSHAPLLFSLHPQWAELILSGRKTIEVRRRFAGPHTYPALGFIYATGRVGGVVGMVRLTRADTVSPADLAGPLAGQTCIPGPALHAYLGARPQAQAIHVDRPVRLETPVSLQRLRALGATPPQLFSWANGPLLDALITAPIARPDGATWAFAPIDIAALAPQEPIFSKPRALYSPGFDQWLAKSRQERRQSWGVYADGILQALAITAPRADGTTKLCMFHALVQGNGIGGFLLDRVLAMLAAGGATQVYGEILRQGDPAIARFFARAGFAPSNAPGKPESLRVTLALDGRTGAPTSRPHPEAS